MAAMATQRPSGAAWIPIPFKMSDRMPTTQKTAPATTFMTLGSGAEIDGETIARMPPWSGIMGAATS